MPGELSSIVGIEVKTNERTDFPAVARAVPQIISLTFLELPLSGQTRLALCSKHLRCNATCPGGRLSDVNNFLVCG
jgi:hypothetical protein